MILVGQKDKTQAVERPPGDVHLRLVAVDVINGSLNSGDFLSFFVRNLSIKLSSRAITSSTVSRESARSSTKEALLVTSSCLTPGCSPIIFLTRSSIVLILLNFLSKLAFAMVFVVYKMLKNLQLNPAGLTTILRYFEALPPNNANHFALIITHNHADCAQHEHFVQIAVRPCTSRRSHAKFHP